MKKLAVVIAMVLMSGFQAWAQEDNLPRRGAERSPEKMAERVSERLAEQLELNEKQKSEVYALHLEQAKDREEERKARREAMKESRENFLSKMEDILTPEQQKVWEEKRRENREKMQQRRGKGPRGGHEAGPRHRYRGGSSR
jgi:periplasmic protein CpxP/Spy